MRPTTNRRPKTFMPKVDKGRCCPLNGFDYKAVGLLKKYITDTGKIESGSRNGNCAKCQRNLTIAIKRARHMALIPYASNHRYDTSLISLAEETKEETVAEETKEETVAEETKEETVAEDK